MIALHILGAVALLIFLLLFSSVSVSCRVDDEVKVKIRYLFLKFNLPKHRKKSKNKAKTTQTNISYIKQLIEQNGLLGAIKELLFIVKTILSRGIKMAHHIRVKRFDMVVTAASDDPAKTAVEYGALCSVVFPALSGFQSLMKWNDRKTKVLVNSDFCVEKPTLLIDFKIKLKLFFIVKAGLSVILALVRRKISKTPITTENNINNNTNSKPKSVVK